MPKKLSTLFAIAGALCYTLALWFMYRETCKYYEETYNIETSETTEPEEPEEPEKIKPVKKQKDAADKEPETTE